MSREDSREDIVAYKIKFLGRVQGVGFRYFCSKLAKSYNIRGYVKNMNDGSVKLVCEGTKENISIFIEECKKGNGFSSVDDIEMTSVTLNNYVDFKVEV